MQESNMIEAITRTITLQLYGEMIEKANTWDRGLVKRWLQQSVETQTRKCQWEREKWTVKNH